MRTQEAFKIPILDCARRLNLKFDRTWVNGEGLTEHVFHCPLRKDKNASIFINPTKNVAYDNGGIVDGGGIVWFINYTHGHSDLKDTRNALKILDGIYPELKHPSKNRSAQSQPVHISKTLPLFGNAPDSVRKIAPAERYGIKEKSQLPAFEVLEVKPIFSYPLKNYLKYERKLNLDICSNYVSEVVYKHIKTDRTYYAVGFKSGDTWAVRRGGRNKKEGFKAFLGKGIDISVFDYKTDRILLFEGFIDFLSYLTVKKYKTPLNTCIVLNSAVQIKKLIIYVKDNPNIKEIEYFRDRDKAGLSSLKQLEKELNSVNIRDMSETYPNHDDLNRWLTDEYSRA